jgi:transcriptional regulator with GAF, ATPase, and Fis domain
VPQVYPAAVTRSWQFDIVNDLSMHPLERDQPPARMGARSTLRIPIWFGNRVIGGVGFLSFDRARYSTADVAIARRLADYVAVGLSHHQLAERGRQAAALRERAANLEMLDGLLKTLTGVLDIREVFDRVSAIAQKVLPHDGMSIAEVIPPGDVVRMHASHGLGDLPRPFDVRVPDRSMVTESWDYRIIDDLQALPEYGSTAGGKAGMRSAMYVSIRLEGRLFGGLNFYSNTPGHYVQEDVLVARRITDHVALALSHRRLAEEARRNEELRAQTERNDLLDELLASLIHSGDLSNVFESLSAIARKILPHDALFLTLLQNDGTHARCYVSAGLDMSGVPDVIEVPEHLRNPEWDYQLADDLMVTAQDSAAHVIRQGIRAALQVAIRLEEGRMMGGLAFLSRTPSAFSQDDIQVARRITDHVALALSHRRLAEEARVSAELRAKAERNELLDELLATLTDTGELSEVFDRISTIARKVLPHDALLLPIFLPDGIHARRYVSSGVDPAALPDVVEIPEYLRGSDWDSHIADDLTSSQNDGTKVMVKLGFRSAMRVPIRLGERTIAALAFMSSNLSAFTQDHVSIARRIADRVALGLSRERGVEAARRADEATERAAKLEMRVRALTEELDARTGYRRVVGESVEWRQVLTQATQVAATETTVLLLGESGTGKEVVARFLHRASSRNAGPFIALNCAALPEQLLEAELFGYERGAYTGATQSKPGQLEQAAGGTLFLDEVGEMSLSAQAKFLRVLQEREFQRLGGTRVLRTDARIVAATNRDLQRAITLGQFREDLYYRLNVFAIGLPALRNRRDDILPLSEAFLKELGRGLGRPPGGISREARQMLVDYHWPGNVRELRNILERAAILCDGGLIVSEHLAITVAPPPASVQFKGVAPTATRATPAVPSSPLPASAGDLQSMERAMIEQALQTARFNKSKAAKALGMTRHQLYIRMRKYGFEE